MGEQTAHGTQIAIGGEEFEFERRPVVPVGERGVSVGQEEGTGQLGRKVRGVTCLQAQARQCTSFVIGGYMFDILLFFSVLNVIVIVITQI